MSDERPTEPVPATAWWSHPAGDVWAPPGTQVGRGTGFGGSEAASAGSGLTGSGASGAGWPQPAEVPPHDTFGAVAPPRARGLSRGRLFALLLTVALLAGVVGGVVGSALTGNGAENPHRTVDLGQTVNPQPVARAAGSVSAIAVKVLPSVVSIDVRNGGSGDTGSGVILTSDGYILTNNHVVSAATGGGSITVVFYAKESVRATVVGTDPQSDLAVIKAQGVKGLRKADLGSSAGLQVGDLVVAIGSPLGLTGTVTSGIVSAKDRPVPTSGAGSAQQVVIDAIQTDAAINPGNSGGPLVDGAGAVVGINSAIATLGGSTLGGQGGNIGVGFAIPIDQARSIAGELISTGHATHPVIGVSAQSVDTERAKGIPGGRPGALVIAVTSGGGAEKAGIRKNDIITAVDSEPIASVDELIVLVRKHRVGESAKVTYVRGGKEATVPVLLGRDSR